MYRCLIREPTKSDLAEAKSFDFVESRLLNDYGIDISEEAKTQISYDIHMKNCLQN